MNHDLKNVSSFFVHCKIIQQIMSETDIEQRPISYIQAVFSRCTSKVGVLENFANFTGKHLSWSVFLAKFLRTFLKRHCNAGVFL